jgi:transposase
MVYVGVDIGKNRHAAAAIGDAGEIVLPPRFVTQDAGGFASLSGALGTLGGAAMVIVGMEATGHYWKPLRHDLAAQGYRVDVINPLITSREASADVRGRKTDKRDAIAIANVVRRGGYSTTPVEHNQTDATKAFARQRRYLVGRRSDAKRRLAAALDVVFPEAAKAFGDLYGAASLAVIEAFPSARLMADADIRKLTSLFTKTSHGKLSREMAEEIRTAARQSVSRTIVNEGEEFVATQTVDEIRTLDGQIDAVEKRLLSTEAQPAARILESIKGAGKIQPRVFAAELGNLDRFAGPDMSSKILAFAGCEPRVRESGTWKGRSKMSKRGSAPMRSSLYLMACTIRLHTPFFNEIYKRHIAKGKHHNVAISHVMRKIVEVMCGMYNTDTTFVATQPKATPC